MKLPKIEKPGKKYISLNIDAVIANRLKMAAAKQGYMRYSVIAEKIFAEAYKELDKLDNYADIKDRFKRELTGFLPLKRGKPPTELNALKVKLTLYISFMEVKYLYRLKRRYGMSLSGVGELLLRVGLKNDV